MDYLNFDQDEADERVAHMLRVLQPHSDVFRPMLEAQRSIFIHLPNFDNDDKEMRDDAITTPDDFMTGILMAKCYEIAIAEQQTKTKYPDKKIFEKVKCDLGTDIIEMAQLERGASSGRTH